ncbi:MAG: hypothetical protein ACJA0G_000390 [Kangiellaceae bacterium]|jgi:hypothetical protein
MKLLTKVTVISALTFSLAGIANAGSALETTDNYITSKLCVAAAQGDKAKLARGMKSARLSKSYVINKMKCNNLSFTTFVDKYGTKTDEVFDYLISSKYSKEQKVAA